MGTSRCFKSSQSYEMDELVRTIFLFTRNSTKVSCVSITTSVLRSITYAFSEYNFLLRSFVLAILRSEFRQISTFVRGHLINVCISTMFAFGIVTNDSLHDLVLYTFCH